MHRDTGNPFALLSPAVFWLPERLVPSAWMPHAPFAFWLIEAHRPRTFVELGTHHGFSYLVFCQAVDRLDAGTRCHAVDHWKGDEHAGFYGEEVYEELREYHDARYGTFSELIRSSFDQAANHFMDETIDLLHIDGAHRLDSVRGDFETWLPKMSDRGVILLHDINVHRDDFGVHALWESVKARYPHFEFDHGHGLGVLGTGARASETLGQLFALGEDPSAASQFRRAFARLGEAIADSYAAQEAGAALRSYVEGAELEQRRLQEELERASAESAETIARLNAEASASQTEVRRLTEEVAAAQLALEAAELEAAASRAKVAELHQSTSWRITAPARAVSRALKRLLRRR